MRVTDSMTFNAVLQGQNRAARRLLDASRAASSGERVAAPSDDPVAWSAAVGHEARISRLEGRAATTTRAAGDLDAAEAALAGAGDLVEWTTGREAALTLPVTYSPVDCAIVAIVDHAWSDKRYLG